MKIGFIGAGRAGTALGIYFKSRGEKISGYYSRDIEDAVKASMLTESVGFSSIEELLQKTDIVMITTNDDEIEKTAEYISKVKQLRSEHFFIHVSGSLTSKALNSLANKGCEVCSMHPMQSIATALQGARTLHDTVFTIESDSEAAIEKAIILVKRLGNSFQVLKAGDKTIYHAGACVLSNYMVTLAESAFSYFRASGINNEDILKLTEPLIRSTVDNILLNGTDKALTGPIARGDIKTIEKHLEAIKEKIPEEEELYKVMGKNTIKIADRIRSEKGQNPLEIGGIFDEK